MQKIKVSELREHPKNTFYFDNMSGEKWKEFLKSIETSGVIEPVIINQDKTIISGHQRYRACLELGIEEVLCDIRIYDDEQQELKDLIETNIRQRGDISSSSLKMGRIIKTLEECYGVRQGSAGKSDRTMYDGKSQKDIAEELGMTQSTYTKTKKLLELIPELQELLEQGKLSASVGSRILARLSPEEQKEVLEDLGVDGLSGKTQAQLKEYVSKLQAKEEENEKLKKALEKEKNKPKEKEIVVEPDTKAQEELKTLRQDKVKLLEELEMLRKEMFNTPSTQQEDAKVKELEEKIAKLQSDLDFKDEVIKDKDKLIENRDNLLKEKDNLLNQKENLIENEKELKESYKKGYDEYYNLINTTCDYQSTEESVGRSVGAGYETVKFLIDIEELLKYKLAPLKYERFLRDIKSNETVLNNVNELLDVVQSWTDEMRSLVNGVSHTSNNGIINNFVDGVIVE